MASKRIEDLFIQIESTANSVKILEGTDMPQVRDIIEGRTPVTDAPSKASLVEFYLRGLAGRAEELQELLGYLINEVAKEEEAGRL